MENEDQILGEAAEQAVETTEQANTDTPAVSLSESGNIKIDFSKLKEETNAVQEQSTDEGLLQPEQPEMGLQEVEQGNTELIEVATEENNEEEIAENPVVTVVEGTVIQEQTTEPIKEVEKPVLPENLQKVVEFMEETGGSIEDYVKLNTDYSKLDEDVLIMEHIAATNPDLSPDDIAFLMEDKYDFDEEYDDAKDIKRKQLAKKAAVKEAKQYLEGLKSKYYQEIKSTSRLTPEQREAVEFFNRYKEENEAVMQLAEKQKQVFQQKTEEVFSNEFNGFDFKVGDKAYKLNVKNLSEVKNTQADISNFVKKFLSEDNTMKDAKGYHKGLFAAMNPDLVAQHFYEQGKADAIKETMERSKNIDMNPRGVHEASTISNGWTVRAVNGQDVSRLKVKTNR
jgi:hypothetical protein